MSRQNFVSKELFVAASEKETLQTILNLPQMVSNIKLIDESKVSASYHFLYERPVDAVDQHVRVSVLPFSHEQSRVMLHVGYANGAPIDRDKVIKNTLYNFEAAVQAALQGTIENYLPQELKESVFKKLLRSIAVVLTSMSVFLLWKKMEQA